MPIWVSLYISDSKADRYFGEAQRKKSYVIHHAITAGSNFSTFNAHRNGTASLANREMPAKRRTSALSENDLQFHADRGSSEIAGQFGGVGGIRLVNY